MRVLVDRSVGIDYFRVGLRAKDPEGLLDDNSIVTNDLVLAGFRCLGYTANVRRNSRGNQSQSPLIGMKMSA